MLWWYMVAKQGKHFLVSDFSTARGWRRKKIFLFLFYLQNIYDIWLTANNIYSNIRFFSALICHSKIFPRKATYLYTYLKYISFDPRRVKKPSSNVKYEMKIICSFYTPKKEVKTWNLKIFFFTRLNILRNAL